MFSRVAIGVAVAAASVSATALACRCPPLTPAAAYRMADTVVLARVAAIQDVDRYRRVYTLDVQHAWKRDPGARMLVWTRRTTCMLNLAAGGDYLVYMSRQADGTEQSTLCSGSLPVVKAEAALAWLGQRGKAAR